VRVIRWGKDVAQTYGSFFFSSFEGRSLSSQFGAIVIMSLVMSKGKLERIACSFSRFKLLRLSSFLWFRRLSLIASPNKIDSKVDCEWCDFPFMNCLPSPVGLTKSLVTKPKLSSAVMP